MDTLCILQVSFIQLPSIEEYNQNSKTAVKCLRRRSLGNMKKKAIRVINHLPSGNLENQNSKTDIALELFQSGRMREASAILSREVLLHSENTQAQALFDHVNFRRSGMMFYHEFNQTNLPTQIPTLSLCLIAKNEEKSIGHCLDSFKDYVVEMIVVDTGSTDRTVEIAREHGAEVRFFPWIGDFAAARNVSIENAKGDWILRSDADEWAEPSEIIKLVNAAASGVADLFYCKTVSSDLYASDQNAYGIENLRLFRNHLGLKFEHAIHETVTTNVAQRLGLKSAVTNIVFLHSGYDVAETDMEAKIERNLKICDLALQRDPNDRFMRMMRGVILYRKDHEKGSADMDIACTDLPQDFFPSKYLELSYIFLIQYYAHLQDKEKVAHYIDEALTDFSLDALMLQYLGEKLLYALGDAGYAINVLNRALTCNPSDMVADVLDRSYYNPIQAKRVLLEAHQILGNHSAAQALIYDLSMSSSPTTVIAPHENGIPSFTLGVLQKLDAVIRDISSKGASIDRWLQMALLELQLGRNGLSILCSQHALEKEPTNQDAFNLMGIASMHGKNYSLARECFVNALILNPSNKNSRENLDNFCTLQGIDTAKALSDQGIEWFTQKHFQKAAYAFMISNRLDPRNEDTQKYLSQCLSNI